MSYKGGSLSDGTPLNVAVYKAYRNAGLSHNQALAITAEVGRENSFNASTLFGNHTDPAANGSGKPIRNLGMLSWNQGRDTQLERYLNQQGVMRGGQMSRSQANLNAQAKFSVGEMRSPKYAGKLKGFWSNPNASPEAFARELGKNYIVWAYGQNTIKARGGGRQAFNWKAHDGYRRGYLNTLNNMLGGKESYQAPQGGDMQPQRLPPDPRLSMSAPQLLADLRKRGGNDIQILYELANNNGLAGREIKQLMAQGAKLDDIAGQLGLKVPQAEPEPVVDMPDIGSGYEDFMASLTLDEPQEDAQQFPELGSGYEEFMANLKLDEPEPQATTAPAETPNQPNAALSGANNNEVTPWQTPKILSDSTLNEKNERAPQMLKSSWVSQS